MGCFQGIMAVMLMNSVETKETVQAFLNAILSKSGELTEEETINRNQLKLKILVTLFNMLSVGELKYETIVMIFRYAIDTNQSEAVVPYHTYAEQWIEKWGLDASQIQGLSIIIYESLRVSPTTISNSHVFMRKYLSTFDKTTVLSGEGLDRALSSFIEAIKAPLGAFEQRKLLLECISADQTKGSDLSAIYALLSVIVNGTIEEYKSFASSNGAVLATYNLDSSTLEENMKLLAVCRLANGREKLSYHEVSEALNVPYEDVELWVVNTIAQGVLEVRMDQVEQTITVTKTIQNVFEVGQWVELQEKLNKLKSSLSSLKDEMTKGTTK